MITAKFRSGLLMAILPAMLFLTGCLTARQEAVESRFPQNRVFERDRLTELGPEDSYFFGEWDRGGTQTICLLQLAPGTVLEKRYHAERDLTLLVVSGSAIVRVEETRYFVERSGAVVLPRYTAYSIVPHETDQDFVALMVFSPGYDEDDTFLED